MMHVLALVEISNEACLHKHIRHLAKWRKRKGRWKEQRLLDILFVFQA